MPTSRRCERVLLATALTTVLLPTPPGPEQAEIGAWDREQGGQEERGGGGREVQEEREEGEEERFRKRD